MSVYFGVVCRSVCYCINLWERLFLDLVYRDTRSCSSIFAFSVFTTDHICMLCTVIVEELDETKVHARYMSCHAIYHSLTSGNVNLQYIQSFPKYTNILWALPNVHKRLLVGVKDSQNNAAAQPCADDFAVPIMNRRNDQLSPVTALFTTV